MKSDLLIDIGKTTYGVAFHPRFAENRYSRHSFSHPN